MNPEQPGQTPLQSTSTDQHSQMSPNTSEHPKREDNHNPVKSIKIDFHSADGMATKPIQQKPLGGPPAGGDLGKSGGTPQSTLSPLHEVLFKHWATANGIPDTEDPSNHYDYRGFFSQQNGQVFPPGQVANAAQKFNQLQNSKLSQDPSQAGLGTPGIPPPPPAFSAVHPELTTNGPDFNSAVRAKNIALQHPSDPNSFTMHALQGSAAVDEPIQQLLHMIGVKHFPEGGDGTR